MKIWILGAEGLLGRALSHLCKEKQYTFLATGKIRADITDLEQLKRLAAEHLPTHIVNCAAYTDVDRAEADPAGAFAVNAGGAEHLGLIAKAFGAQLLHLSTDYIFSGSQSERPYKESDPASPKGVYATSKWEGEMRLLDQFPRACIVRTSWLFGRRGKNFISTLLKRLQAEEEIKALVDQKGRATYCYDLAEVILLLLSRSGIFHFANEGELSRYQIAVDMREAAIQRGYKIACKEILPAHAEDFPALAHRPLYSVLCTEKIAGVLGRKPRCWSEALKEYLDHAAE